MGSGKRHRREQACQMCILSHLRKNGRTRQCGQTFRQEKQRELERFLVSLDRDWLEKQIEACIPQKVEARQHGKS